MAYEILKGRKPPKGRELRRKNLNDLIILAGEMEVGDAALVSFSEAQVLRVILAAYGFHCATDGWQHIAGVPGNKILAFKIETPNTYGKNKHQSELPAQDWEI